MNIQIHSAESQNALARIEDLATIIWRQHYTPIIGEAQITYMLGKFQSLKAMTHQIEQQNFHYFGIHDAQRLIGYFAVQPQTDCLLLSKLYLLDSQRGKGVAKIALNKIIEIKNRFSLPVIRLTVNKHNTNSITAYKRMGFSLVGEDVFDIGNGYVMDDYILER